ncbi:MAG: glycoside hydrolase family 28 protein [Bacteroides sp.]|nr:glycoside hydrolase family 28 protein [Barnesiella sp.]MBD5368860.1 glycoside hydrolase family 28 protein [Bacteroides sp.]
MLYLRNIIAAVLAIVAGTAYASDYGAYYDDLPFNAPAVSAPSIPDLTVRLADFGGVADGITLNTEAIERAIAHLSAQGGGHLVLDEGVWLSGPITMKSNIDLHVTHNAILLFTTDKSRYAILDPDEGTATSMRQPPIYAHHISNFSITGSGVIDGNGEAWRPVKRFKVSDAEWKKMQRLGLTEYTEGTATVYYPTMGNPTDKIETKRARLIRIVCCENFMVKDVVIQNSPSFHLNVVLSSRFVIDGVMVRCPWNAQNGDGIDLSSCTDALIVNTSVDAGDDALCLKSGIGDAGRRRGPCENIVIDNCTVFHGHGGFVIGSDNAGGMRNIMVRRCRFIDTDTGLRFKSGRDRGGLMCGVFVRDVVMCDIAGEAILFDSYYEEKVGDGENVKPEPVTADTPVFRGFFISGLVCRDAGRAVVMKGLPEMHIADVSITDCTFVARQGMVINNADDIELKNVRLQLAEGPVLKEHNASVKQINVSEIR